MHNSFGLGLLLIVVGGFMEGSFSLPLKYTPKWEWENTWGACSLAALVLIPWPLALLTVPHLMEVYRHSSVQALLGAVGFGVGWGVGGIFFGLGLAALGLSLGLSLIIGLIAIGGSIIPLTMQHPEQLSRPPGLVLMAGIAIMILGIAVCARAGQLKEKAAATADSQAGAGSSGKVRYGLGLFFCVASGLLSALVNFALIFGAGIADNAARQGVDPSAANNAVWALVFTANYVVNVGYCAYLAKRKKTLNKFLSSGTAVYWPAAIVMGLLWGGYRHLRYWNDSVGSLRRNSGVSCNAHQLDHRRECTGVFDGRMARHRTSTQAHNGIRCVPTRDRNCGHRLFKSAGSMSHPRRAVGQDTAQTSSLERIFSADKRRWSDDELYCKQAFAVLR
jgi:L-rhamnose-H+ transport protein